MIHIAEFFIGVGVGLIVSWQWGRYTLRRYSSRLVDEIRRES